MSNKIDNEGDNIMINVAILAASRGVSLVATFRKALQHMGGGNLYALDVVDCKPALFFADEAVICPDTDDPNYISFLTSFCRNNQINLLFSCRDEDLQMLSRHKLQIEKTGCKVMVADEETIEICSDKNKFYKFCIKNNFSTPRVFTKNEKKSFPLFVKPVEGKGSRNNFIVKNEKFLNAIIENYDENFIIQEFVKEDEYTIDLFSDFEGNVISVVPRKRILTIAGESYHGKTFNNQTIIDESIRMAKLLKLIGHNTIQCFYNGSVVKFIEINPRFGGAANLGIASGHNTPEYLIKIISGEKIESQVGKFINDLVMLRYTSDLFVNKPEEKNKIFCIDIDGTICTEGEEYHLAKPIPKVIKKINKLYENGNKIILFTSRGVYSGYDWSVLTKKQLQDWNVKYHELYFKKPYADYYIDNKAIDILYWN